MMGYAYTLTNRAGDSIILNNFYSESQSYIILQEYPSFEVDIRNEEINKEGQHGIWDFYSFYGKRLINFSGLLVGNTEKDVIELQNLLQKVVALPAQPYEGNDGIVVISWTDVEGVAMQIEAKLNTSVKFTRERADKRTLSFNLIMKASNPFIENAESIVVSGTRAFELSGFTLPVYYPTNIPTNWRNYLVAENEGFFMASTVIRLYGSSHFGISNPMITNLTNEMYMGVSVVISGAESYVEFDSKKGTVEDNNGNDLSGYLISGSQFMKLATGENHLVYTSDQNTDSNNPSVTREIPDEKVTAEFRTITI